MNEQVAGEIVSAIQEIITSVAPDAKEKTMYGGLVYELDYLEPKRLFCGIFVRKDYVTIEFDRGTELQDNDNLLEGKGKNRRHLTISALKEITSKKVSYYILQSYNLVN